MPGKSQRIYPFIKRRAHNIAPQFKLIQSFSTLLCNMKLPSAVFLFTVGVLGSATRSYANDSLDAHKDLSSADVLGDELSNGSLRARGLKKKKVSNASIIFFENICTYLIFSFILIFLQNLYSFRNGPTKERKATI